MPLPAWAWACCKRSCSCDTGAWALGWLVTSYVITANVKEQFAVFGGSGALVFGLLTWLLLAVLFQGTVAKVEERQAAPAR